MVDKFIIFGDMQFRKNYRRSLVYEGNMTSWLEKQIGITSEIFEYAISNDIETVIHNGDLFEEKNRIPQDLYNHIWGLFKEYSKKGLNIILNTGNHDLLTLSGASSLYPFQDFTTVIRKPTDIEWTKGIIRIIPYSRVSGNLKVPEGEYNILILHEDISGLKYGPLDLVSSNQLKYQVLKEWDLVLNGHIHKPQEFKNVINIGSPMIQDFGERDEQKRFIHMTSEGPKFISINCPKFITLAEIPEDKDKLIRDDFNYYRISISSEELGDPIFNKFNIEPYIDKQVKRKARLKKDLPIESKVKSYIKLKNTNLDSDKLLKIGLELLNV